MKSLIAALAMAGILTAAANAQSPTGREATIPVSPLDEQALALTDGPERPQTKQPNRAEKHAPPAPAVNPPLVDQIEAAMKAPATQPTELIEPFLLTKDAGPFMVLAKTFRGPDAERFAIALAKELRTEFSLPAYILRTRDLANRGLVRKPGPGVPAGQAEANAGNPKKNRAFEECAVLVGNEKSLKASDELLHRVKRLQPKCLDALPHAWNNRRHLKGAIRTTNPYVPATDLFPRKREKVVIEAKPEAQGKLDPAQDGRLLLLTFPPVEAKK